MQRHGGEDREGSQREHFHKAGAVGDFR
jgi:hypothetical protein